MWRELSSSARAARTATVLPEPTSPVTDADGGLVDAPGDAGDSFGVAGVAVDHGRGQVFGERGAGETPMRAEPFDAHRIAFLVVVVVVVSGSMCSQAQGSTSWLGSTGARSGRLWAEVGPIPA